MHGHTTPTVLIAEPLRIAISDSTGIMAIKKLRLLLVYTLELP